MANHDFDFDFTKLKKVSVEAIQANGWNPKDKDTKEYKQVVRSIENNGLRQPIVVREVDDHYEIIDGEQRFTGAKEVGYKEVWVYNEGKLDEKAAKALTIWYEVQVPFNEVDLSHLVVELDDQGMELPYTEAEIVNFRNMAEFNFNYNQDTPDASEETDDDGFVTFNVRMTEDQRSVIQRAIERVQGEDDCSEGRALELIAADFLGGVELHEDSEAEI